MVHKLSLKNLNLKQDRMAFVSDKYNRTKNGNYGKIKHRNEKQ